jgi:hypothetical protein
MIKVIGLGYLIENLIENLEIASGYHKCVEFICKV